MGTTFADDMAARRATNPLLGRASGGYGGESLGSQWRGSGDYDFAMPSIDGGGAYGGDYRAALNAAEREMNPGYYTSRSGYSYTVQSGDTLSSILNGDMTHVGLVAADNGLNGSNIRSGQTIFIADKDQYGIDALASFSRHGQAIYNHDNARLEELQRRAQLFVNGDGSGSDYGMMRRVQEYEASTMLAGANPITPQMVERAT